MLLAGLPLRAVTIDGITYTLSGTSATVSGGPSAGDVVIPSTIESDGTTYTVTAIAQKAFQNGGITSVSIPATVTSIGNYAFDGCKSLTTATLAEGTAKLTLGTYLFRNCSALTAIDVPATVTAIPNYAFDGCSSLRTATFKEGLTKFGTYSLRNCSSLTSIEIPSTVTAISSALYGCSSLTSLVIPDKVSSFPTITNCSSLRSITIGAKIFMLMTSYFNGCDALEEINVSEASTYFSSIDGVVYSKDQTKYIYCPVKYPKDTLVLPATVTSCSNTISNLPQLKKVTALGLVSVGNLSFQNCTALETVEFGAALQNFGIRCFTGATAMKNLIIDAANPYLKVYNNTALMSADGSKFLFLFPFDTSTEYTIPDGVKTIGMSAFYFNENLVSVSLPETLDSIEASAFYRNTKIGSIVIPDGVKHISDNAFWYCRAMSDIKLPANLISIGESAFANIFALEDITLPASLASIGNEAFSGTSLVKLEIPDNVTAIGERAFNDCEYLTDVTIGTGIKSIGAGAFTAYYETSEPLMYIKSVVPPAIDATSFNSGQVIYVPEESVQAYKNDSVFSRFTIMGRTATTVANVTLSAPGTLGTLISSSDVTSIEDLTVSGPVNGTDFGFMLGMPALHKINLLDASIVAGGTDIVTVPNVFPARVAPVLARLDTIVLPQNLTALADSAFIAPDPFNGDKMLKSVTLPASLRSIGKSAFESRGGIQEITLPKNITHIGEAAFMMCSSLKSIEVPAGVDTLSANLFTNCDALEHITLNEGLRVIDDQAISYCHSLTSLELPSTVDSIAMWGIGGNRGLVSVKLSPNLRTLGHYALAYSPSLESIELPSKLEYMGGSCLAGCVKLTKVTIPESVKTIGRSVFSMDSLLQRIDIPRYVTEIGANVFFNCKSLRLATVAYDYNVPGEPELDDPSTDMSATKVRLQNYAFQNCRDLESVYIGSTISFIGDQAFFGTSLKRVFVANTTPPDMFEGEPAFENYDADLYVPQASINLYKTARYWCNFTKIHALENQYNAIDELFDDPDAESVTVENGFIIFRNPQANVSVTSLSGQVIYSGKAREVEVNPGLYIITVNSSVYKVISK